MPCAFIETVLPTASRLRNLDTGTSTISRSLERLVSHGSKCMLEALIACQLFELNLKIHHVLLVWAISGRAWIESEAAGLVEVPLRGLSIGKCSSPADHSAGSGDLVDRDGDFAG